MKKNHYLVALLLTILLLIPTVLPVRAADGADPETPERSAFVQVNEILSYCFDEETATLTVRNPGRMISFLDYSDAYGFDENVAPWGDYARITEHLVIEEGCRSIGASAFYGFDSLQSVSLPDTLEEIGDTAFVLASLNGTLTIPDNVERIGNSAFQDASVQKVVLGASVRQIGSQAFSSFYGTVELNDRLELIDSMAFACCPSMKQFDLPASLRELKEGALSFSRVEKVTIRAMQTRIEPGAIFYGATIAAYDNSDAAAFARQYGYRFESLGTHEHTFGAWETAQEAYCEKSGTMQRSCTSCGFAETKQISPLPHDYSAWSTVQEATCEHAGLHERTCGRCGKTETETLQQLPHTFGRWRTLLTPSEAERGIDVRFCSECDAHELRQVDYVPPETPDGPTDPAGSGEGEASSQSGDGCPLCGKRHEGFFGKIIGWFHLIIYRLRTLFSFR